MAEKISVIIPCYNAEAYIDRCLACIEKQTYGMDSLEVILIDDASTDNTCEHMLRFEKKYQDNVVIIECRQNSGPGSIRNIGMKYATGTYVTFMDADDMADVSMLQKLQTAIAAYDADIVECDYCSFTDADMPVTEVRGADSFIRITNPEERGRFILDSFKTAVWGRLYKRSFLEENSLHFPENMSYGEDNYFSGLLMLTCNAYVHIGETLYYYYQNSGGLIRKSGNDERIMQLADIMKLYIAELDRRGFLDGELAGYGREFEWYMIYKYFMDPVSFLISRNVSNWKKKVAYFGGELLKYFPEAYDNVYLNSNPRWSDYISLLKEASVSSS